VLGALTLVNESAANSMPWLFQSVAYFWKKKYKE
jgi:hypothetical protein